MLTMLARLTRPKLKIKIIPPHVRGSVVLHTLQHCRTEQIKCSVSRFQERQALLASKLRFMLAVNATTQKSEKFILTRYFLVRIDLIIQVLSSSKTSVNYQTT